MLSYVYFGTNDLGKATAFYDATLVTLGMRRCITNDPEWDCISAGWGNYEDGGGRELDQKPASVGNGNMVAFTGPSWKAVDDFYAAALTNGGVSDGAPGLRPQYGRDFYAAYVRDPDGNKVAAVCRRFTDPQ
jgi:catechol 2,3-dioxygenase-like lactoylglutathione lyase family enzyme